MVQKHLFAFNETDLNNYNVLAIRVGQHCFEMGGIETDLSPSAKTRVPKMSKPREPKFVNGMFEIF